MTGVAADLLVLWAAATAVGSGVLAVVVLGQGAVAKARGTRRTRRRVGQVRRSDQLQP